MQGIRPIADMTIYEWKADTAEASFTIPADAASGDCFTLNLRARDDADAMMTRYAEVRIVVE